MKAKRSRRDQSGSEEEESQSRNAVDHQSGSEERAEARRERKQGESGSKEGESNSRNAVDHRSGSKERAPEERAPEWKHKKQPSTG